VIYPIRIMSLDDYDPVYHLWSTAEGMSLGEEDGREGIAFGSTSDSTGWKITG